MGDVVNLKDEKPVGVFVCAACGCQSFSFRTDHVITCCGCETSMRIDIFDGRWVKDDGGKFDDAESGYAVRITEQPTPEFVLRRAIAQQGDVTHVVIVRRDGGVITWGSIDREDKQRRAWLFRRLRDAANLITRRGRHGTR